MKTVERIENILKEKTLLAQYDFDFFEKLLISIQSDNHNLDEEWQEDKANSMRKGIHALLELNRFPKQNRDVEDKEIYLKKYSGLISFMSEDLLQSAVEFLNVRDRIVLCPTNKQWYKMIQSTLIYEFAVPFMRLNQKLGTIYLVTHRSPELNRKICLPTIEEQRIHLKKALEDGKELASLGRLNHFFFNEVLERSDIEISVTTSNVETNVTTENLMALDDIWSRPIREFLIKVILVLFALHSERSSDPLSSQLSLIFRLIIFTTSLTIVPIKTKRETKLLPHHQPETQLQEHLQNFSRVKNYSIESKALIRHSIVNRRRDNFPTSTVNPSLAEFSFS
jgi:hypothetical protein